MVAVSHKQQKWKEQNQLEFPQKLQSLGLLTGCSAHTHRFPYLEMLR